MAVGVAVGLAVGVAMDVGEAYGVGESVAEGDGDGVGSPGSVRDMGTINTAVKGRPIGSARWIRMS